MRNEELERELFELAEENKQLQTKAVALETLVIKMKRIIQEWMQNADFKQTIG
jgi:hypothetical protein